MRLKLGLVLLILAWPAHAAYFHGGTYRPSADPTSLVLPAYNDAYANWKNAGLQSVGGIPTRSTQCGATVTPSGLTPPAANDDAAKINAAIQACTGGNGAAGQVVLLNGAFVISMSEFIYIDRGITLRGSGACTQASTTTTALAAYCPTTITVRDGALPYVNGGQCGVDSSHVAACILDPIIYIGPPTTGSEQDFVINWSNCGHNTMLTAGCTATLATDASAGQTTIQVSDTSHFSPGMWAMLDEDPTQVSTPNPLIGFSYPNFNASPEIFDTSGSPVVMREAWGDGSCNYSFCTDRVNEEIHVIKSIGAGPCPGPNCTLTFDDPLTMAFRVSGGHDARVYWPADQNSAPTSFVQYAGVENIGLSRAVNGAINMVFCAYCWVKNVEVGAWIAGAVNMDWSARDQVEDNYFHDCYDCENNGSEYPVGISMAATEDYVANNIIVRGGKGMVGRAANTAVVAYNYVDDTFYQTIPGMIGDYWMDMGVNGSHYVGTHHFLFEGNWAENCDNDDTHGNAIYHTYFRNQCTGLRTPFADPSFPGHTEDDFTGTGWSGTGGTVVSANPSPLRAAGPMALDYWMAYVGNVMGVSGETTTANGWAYSGGTTPSSSNKVIWMAGWKDGNGGSDPYLDGVTATFLFRHGDYDYVNGSIADWTVGFSHTLPNSFYLASAPSYFSGTNCTYPWPWVTPTAANPLQTPTGAGCTATAALPAKARWDAGTPFAQP